MAPPSLAQTPDQGRSLPKKQGRVGSGAGSAAHAKPALELVPELLPDPDILPEFPDIVPGITPGRRLRIRERTSPEPVSLGLLPPPSSWKIHAACRGLGPERFFPGRGEDQTAVLRICAGCPVRLACQDYGMTAPTLLQGIWGGLNERQRRKRRAREGKGTAQLLV